MHLAGIEMIAVVILMVTMTDSAPPGTDSRSSSSDYWSYIRPEVKQQGSYCSVAGRSVMSFERRRGQLG
jgi:hypothetical protein